jgi:hypothetical protein
MELRQWRRQTCAPEAACGEMNHDLSARPALSLQDKLDRIAHERDVLALQRELAQRGLREGDTVLALDGGRRGRLLIARDESPPRLRVQAADGAIAEYCASSWQRAPLPVAATGAAMQAESPRGTIAACTQASRDPAS